MSRYTRQEQFIGLNAQKKLGNSIITIIGCGALGTSSAEIMVRAGIKKIILIDFDSVELSNLQRQGLYGEVDVGKLKVESLKKHLKKMNSNVEIEVYNTKLTEDNLNILDSDLIIDGTDNLKTRFLINNYARKNNIPFIFGSIIRSEGMVYPVIKNYPCFECIFANSKDFENCENQGVLASIARTISSMQCVYAIKILTGEKFTPELTKINLWENNFLKIKVKANPKCSTCNENMEKKDVEFEIIDCETKAMYRVKLKKRHVLNMNSLKKFFEVVIDGGIIIVVKVENEEIIVHNYGELIFKTLKDTKKIKEISKEIFSKTI